MQLFIWWQSSFKVSLVLPVFKVEEHSTDVSVVPVKTNKIMCTNYLTIFGTSSVLYLLVKIIIIVVILIILLDFGSFYLMQ